MYDVQYFSTESTLLISAAGNHERPLRFINENSDDRGDPVERQAYVFIHLNKKVDFDYSQVLYYSLKVQNLKMSF